MGPRYDYLDQVQGEAAPLSGDSCQLRCSVPCLHEATDVVGSKPRQRGRHYRVTDIDRSSADEEEPRQIRRLGASAHDGAMSIDLVASNALMSKPSYPPRTA